MPDAVKSPVAPIRTVFAAATRPGDVENLVVDREQPPRVIDDELARRRQAHARRALVEQVGAEQALQPLDLGADRRLRDAERLRRLGETAQIDDGDQCPQQLGRDIGHDTFAPHGRSGCAGTATNWVVQAVIPTCGFRPPNSRLQVTATTPMASYIPFLPCEIRALTCRISTCLREADLPCRNNGLRACLQRFAAKHATVRRANCSSIRGSSTRLPHCTAMTGTAISARP